MDPLTTTAASGLRSRIESFELLSNNLANTATAGFKADREYLNTYLSYEAVAAEAEGSGSAQVTSPVTESHWTDFTQGTMTPTGNSLDVAIMGKGFLVAKGPDGPLFTRNGSMHLDAGGRLLSSGGHEMVTEDGQSIQADSNLPISIDRDGTVRQGQAQIGRLKIVDFDQPAGLAKRGAAYFQWNGPGNAPANPAKAELIQGHIEGSNASAVDSTVRMVNILRQFETLNRAVQLGGEMNRRAVEEVARVNG